MVRKLTIAGLGLASLTVLAFTPYISLFRPGPADVNPITLGATTWYEPSRAYVTNGSIVVLSNLSSAGGVYNLTNDQAGSFWPKSQAGKNGFVSIGLGVPYLYNQVYHTTMNTQEVVMCVAFTNNAALIGFDSFTSPTSNHSLTVGGGLLQMKMGASSGVVFNNLAATASKFCVYNLQYFATAGQRCYTNMVLTPDAGAGLQATNMSGMVIGDGQTWALLSMFTFADRLLTPAERAAAYYYLTNRFGVMP